MSIYGNNETSAPETNILCIGSHILYLMYFHWIYLLQSYTSILHFWPLTCYLIFCVLDNNFRLS